MFELGPDAVCVVSISFVAAADSHLLSTLYGRGCQAPVPQGGQQGALVLGRHSTAGF